jgi:hypothetical protein
MATVRVEEAADVMDSSAVATYTEPDAVAERLVG